MTLVLAVWLVQAQAVVLENDYVRVTRDGAPCASATVPGCGDRVIVALGDVELRSGSSRRKLTRGDIAVFTAGESYQPTGGAIVRDIVPDRVTFNPPVIHTVKNVGDLPLRGIVIEFKPEPRPR